MREAVDNVLWSCLCVGEKGAVISKHQLGDEFLSGYCVCEETRKVEPAAVYSEMDVDGVWQVLLPHGA